MFRKIGFLSSKTLKISWLWLGIKVGVVTGLIIWWWWENQNKKFMQETASKDPHDEHQSIPLPLEEPPLGEVRSAEAPIAPSSEPDNLTKIEGIGPKISTTLQEAGIRTFKEVAASDPIALKQVLVDAGIRIGYPDTWPEQAALAATGDWEALEEFQSSLQGGRRIN